jgi:hypothetical protein
MAIPATREDFKQYCLRNLGAPVLEVNVDDDQLEDRIDESLDIFRLYHYDGIEKFYLSHKIKASELKITSNNAAAFVPGNQVVGSTTGLTATIYPQLDITTAVTVTAGGSLYSDNIEVIIEGGGGSGATGEATVSGGVVTSVLITNPGSGYITNPTVTIIDKNRTGTGATATANFSLQPNVLFVARFIQTVNTNNSPYVGTSNPTVFLPGEIITSKDINGNVITATVATDAEYIVLGDIENKYIPIADAVYGVTRVLPLYQGTSTSRSIFDLQYQLRLNDLYDLSSTSLIYYSTVMQHLATLDLLLNGKPIWRFNRLQNKLNIDVDWNNGNKIEVGMWVVVEAYRALDPDQFKLVWNEPWLKRYTTALIKRQWGTNLSKFSGLQLPGGVSLDGKALYQEAVQEIKDLEDEIQNKSAPLDFFLG